MTWIIIPVEFCAELSEEREARGSLLEPHFAREGRGARESVVKHNCLFDGWEWERVRGRGSFEWLGAETVPGFGAKPGGGGGG